MLPETPSTASLHYLAGILESNLRIRYRLDSGKLTGVFRSKCAKALCFVQQRFGGIVQRPAPRARSLELTLNASQCYALSETLVEANSPYQPIYKLVLALQKHKLQADKTKWSANAEYRLKYNEGMKSLISELHQTVPNELSFSSSDDYRLGKLLGLSSEASDLPSLPIQWATPKALIEKQQIERQMQLQQKSQEDQEQRKKLRIELQEEKTKQRLLRQELKRVQTALIKAEKDKAKEIERDIKRKKRLEEKELREKEDAENIALGQCRCRKCLLIKPIENFSKARHLKRGYSLNCKACVYELYVATRREHNLVKCKKWQEENPEKFKESQEKQRKKPLVRLRKIIRSRIKAEIDGKMGRNDHIQYVGKTLLELRTYIESLWTQGMTWSNYGHGNGKWVIDHIIPCVAFNWSIQKHLHWCWDYRNLQPVWYSENSRKSDIVNGKSFRHCLLSGNEAEARQWIDQQLSEMGITQQGEYLDSLQTVSTSPIWPLVGVCP